MAGRKGREVTPIRKWLIGGGTAAAMAAAIVSYFEGYEPTPYRDPIGILTVCTGHTGGIDEHRVYTRAECAELLEGDLGHALASVQRHVKVEIADATRAALASFVFNVGDGAFARSTLLRRLNAGEGAAACDELLRWVLADGQRLPGLVLRRQEERELCRAGFAANDNVLAPVPLARPERRAA